MKIVVIDDSKTARMIIVRDLKLLGYADKIIEGDDGVSGLEIIQKENPDLVLTDYYMKKMNGLEFILKGRELGYLGMIGLITSERSSIKLEEARAAGADFVLNKPIRSNDLKEQLDKLVKSRAKTNTNAVHIPLENVVSLTLRSNSKNKAIQSQSPRSINIDGLYLHLPHGAPISIEFVSPKLQNMLLRVEGNIYSSNKSVKGANTIVSFTQMEQQS